MNKRQNNKTKAMSYLQFTSTTSTMPIKVFSTNIRVSDIAILGTI